MDGFKTKIATMRRLHRGYFYYGEGPGIYYGEGPGVSTMGSTTEPNGDWEGQADCFAITLSVMAQTQESDQTFSAVSTMSMMV